jgi:hypothetical protein
MEVKESGVQIRVPATANLMIDSNDRNDLLNPPSNFTITRNQSILNGFFNRIGATELVLEWEYPNINGDINSLDFTVSVGGTPYTVTLEAGFYTVAGLLDELVVLLNAAGTGVTWSVTPVTAQSAGLTATGAFIVQATTLASKMFVGQVFPTTAATTLELTQPDLRPFRYLDFVSSQLTYNQELKDGSTAPINRDVLLRWYMVYDQENTYDAYGYPILMGYKRFYIRRLFNPPKQIRWDPRQPVGQLNFQVFTNDENDGRNGNFPIGAWTDNWDWMLTLQISEN